MISMIPSCLGGARARHEISFWSRIGKRCRLPTAKSEISSETGSQQEPSCELVSVGNLTRLRKHAVFPMSAPTGHKLEEYRRKRDFRKTLEPAGADKAVDDGCLYVMHKHAASHDHFDLRLQHGDVLKSWA